MLLIQVNMIYIFTIQTPFIHIWYCAVSAARFKQSGTATLHPTKEKKNNRINNFQCTQTLLLVTHSLDLHLELLKLPNISLLTDIFRSLWYLENEHHGKNEIHAITKNRTHNSIKFKRVSAHDRNSEAMDMLMRSYSNFNDTIT